MNALGRSIAAEWQKIVTVRLWWILTLVMVVYIGGTALLMAVGGGWVANESGIGDASGSEFPLVPDGPSLTELLISIASSLGYVFPLLFGALMTTGEFRHRTLTPTFLAVPNRGVVLVAKVLVSFVVGVIGGAVAFSATVTASLGMFAFGIEPGLGDGDVWLLVLKGVLAMGLWSALGAALGAVLVNQVAVIVAVLAFTQFVEPIARLAGGFNETIANIVKFLPGSASDALVGASFYQLMTPGQLLPWWGGGLVLLAFVAIASTVAWATNWRRDIT